MLGKGLESLIPNKSQPVPEPVQPPKSPVMNLRSASPEAVFQIEVDKIKPNPHQPRKIFDPVQLEELGASIRELGIIQPLIVCKIERETDYGTGVEYQLIAGERRLMAAKLVGLPRVPAIVRLIPEEKNKLELAIVENVQRADLNPIEAARSYAKLQEQFGFTQREVASRLGKSRETIANALRLLNLPTMMQDAIATNKISESQGRVLLAISDPIKQQYIFQQVSNNNVSVRELKNTIARMNRVPSAGIGPEPETNEFAELEQQLESVLKTKVRIERNGATNKVTINFSSEDELRALVLKIRELH